MRALEVKSAMVSHWKLIMTNWEQLSKLTLLTQEVGEELNVNHFMVIQHLKQIGKVNKLDKGVPHKLAKSQKLSFWSVLFYVTTTKLFSIGLWRAMKVDFVRQLATTSSVAWTRRSYKALLTAKLAWKKGHDHCSVVCCRSDPLQLSESWQNHYIWEVCSANWRSAPKTAMPATSTGQQKGPNYPWQHPTTCCTTKTSEAEQIGLWRSAYPLCSPDLSKFNHYFFKQLNNFLQEKRFYNQQEAENAFQGFVKSQSKGFYATEINEHFSLAKMCWL